MEQIVQGDGEVQGTTAPVKAAGDMRGCANATANKPAEDATPEKVELQRAISQVHAKDAMSLGIHDVVALDTAPTKVTTPACTLLAIKSASDIELDPHAKVFIPNNKCFEVKVCNSTPDVSSEPLQRTDSPEAIQESLLECEEELKTLMKDNPPSICLEAVRDALHGINGQQQKVPEWPGLTWGALPSPQLGTPCGKQPSPVLTLTTLSYSDVTADQGGQAPLGRSPPMTSKSSPSLIDDAHNPQCKMCIQVNGGVPDESAPICKWHSIGWRPPTPPINHSVNAFGVMLEVNPVFTPTGMQVDGAEDAVTVDTGDMADDPIVISSDSDEVDYGTSDSDAEMDESLGKRAGPAYVHYNNKRLKTSHTS